jgi:hypothetical protein
MLGKDENLSKLKCNKASRTADNETWQANLAGNALKTLSRQESQNDFRSLKRKENCHFLLTLLCHRFMVCPRQSAEIGICCTTSFLQNLRLT